MRGDGKSEPRPHRALASTAPGWGRAHASARVPGLAGGHRRPRAAAPGAPPGCGLAGWQQRRLSGTGQQRALACVAADRALSITRRGGAAHPQRRLRERPQPRGHAAHVRARRRRRRTQPQRVSAYLNARPNTNTLMSSAAATSTRNSGTPACRAAASSAIPASTRPGMPPQPPARAPSAASARPAASSARPAGSASWPASRASADRSTPCSAREGGSVMSA